MVHRKVFNDKLSSMPFRHILIFTLLIIQNRIVKKQFPFVVQSHSSTMKMHAYASTNLPTGHGFPSTMLWAGEHLGRVYKVQASE